MRNSHPEDKELPDFSYWKKYIEPKYRDLNYYPPDWFKRRKYIAMIYNYICALCSSKELLGHSHHITPLSEGGTNAIKNLVYLCRSCHEKQHWHLTKQQERQKQEMKERNISEKDYFAEKKRDYESTKDLIESMK